MKHVAQVIPYFYPAMAFGGPAKVVYQYSQELSKRIQITILTSDVFNDKRRVKKSEKLNTKKYNVVYFSNIINSIAYKFRIFSNFGILLHILFNKNKYDLYHFHDVFIIPHIIVSYILRFFNKSYIVSPHGILDPVRLEKKSFLKNILMIFVKDMLKNAVYLVATSNKEKTHLQQLGYKNVQVIFNGVSNTKANSNKKFINFKNNKKINLLFIGKLHQQKGLLEIITALNKSKRKDIILLIAGQNDGDKERLIKKVNELNLKKQVKFLGYVNESDKESLYEISDMFVHPSYSEGFSISILEALNAGLPVLITEQCNFPDVKKFNAGIILESPEINFLTSQLKLLTKKKIKEYQPNAQKLIDKKYSIKIMSKEIIKLYEKYI